MGNATSKAAKSASKLSATSSTARKYPTRSPTTTNRVPPAEPMKPGPTVHPSTPPSAQRTAGTVPTYPEVPTLIPVFYFLFLFLSFSLFTICLFFNLIANNTS